MIFRFLTQRLNGDAGITDGSAGVVVCRRVWLGSAFGQNLSKRRLIGVERRSIRAERLPGSTGKANASFPKAGEPFRKGKKSFGKALESLQEGEKSFAKALESFRKAGKVFGKDELPSPYLPAYRPAPGE